MPFNGAGLFTRLYNWVTDAASNIPLTPSRFDGDANDIVGGLNNCLTRDGQGIPTANLPMNGFRHTGASNGVARTDYATLGQLQDSTVQWLSSVSGTDTIVASSVPVFSTYAAGQIFQFIAAGSNTTTSVTINIDGLGAKSITKQGTTPLAAGDLVGGHVYQIVYDGTEFQVIGVVTSFATYNGLSLLLGTTGLYSLSAATATNALSIQGGTGGVRFVNSAGSAVTMQVTDAGALSAPNIECSSYAVGSDGPLLYESSAGVVTIRTGTSPYQYYTFPATALATSDNSTDVATTAFVQSTAWGQASTPHNQSAPTLGNPYTPNANKPTHVHIAATLNNGGSQLVVNCGGAIYYSPYTPALANQMTSVSFICPAGANYTITLGGSGGTVTAWNSIVHYY